VIQINNGNTSQTLYLKLDGYSYTSTSALVDIEFTSQLTNRKFAFTDVSVVTTNGRYQSIAITPPVETDPSTDAMMEEGMYLVTINDDVSGDLLATRLAFVASVPAFSESTYDAYTVGDTTAYKVYTDE
tara:strand:- start:3186 stop:3572 length:387 start_codon:yes stop_codon:yes gene_type:complete